MLRYRVPDIRYFLQTTCVLRTVLGEEMRNGDESFVILGEGFCRY